MNTHHNDLAREFATFSTKHLAVLADISQRFASSLDIDETLQNIVAQIRNYIQAEAGSVFLIDSRTNELVCGACLGPVDVKGLRVPRESGIIGRAVRENLCQMVQSAQDDTDFYRNIDTITGFETLSILCAPISVQGECFGVIEVLNKRSQEGLFDENDQHFLTILASSAALAIRNAKTAQKLIEQDRLRRELELARVIQAGFFPRPPAPEAPIHGVNIPARGVSGDFYDFFTLSDGRILFAIGDVTGKGIHAALFTAKISSMIKCFGKMPEVTPATLLERLNREVMLSPTTGVFVTIIVGIYDPAHHNVVFANAGHHPPIYHHLGTGEFIETARSGSPPVGILNALTFSEIHLTLHGGVLYMFSDGLIEASYQNEPLTEEGLKRLIEKNQHLPAIHRLHAIVEMVAGYDDFLHDDITLLMVQDLPS